MTAEEILAAANEANPEYVEKTANALFVLQHGEPEFVDEMMKDINIITAVTMEKSAGVKDVLRRGWGSTGGKLPDAAQGVLIAGAASVALGLGAAVAGDLYDAAKRGLTRKRNYDAIVKANPDLQRHDKKELINSFSTLHRFAPEFTADPRLGGELLGAMASLGGGAEGGQRALVEELLNSRKTLVDARKNQFSLGRPDASMMGFKK